jgi:hypothetical protein
MSYGRPISPKVRPIIHSPTARIPGDGHKNGSDGFYHASDVIALKDEHSQKITSKIGGRAFSLSLMGWIASDLSRIARATWRLLIEQRTDRGAIRYHKAREHRT